MIFSDIQPTGAGLQLVKRKIQIAEKVHRLLKLKQDVFVLDLIKIEKEAHFLNEHIEGRY